MPKSNASQPARPPRPSRQGQKGLQGVPFDFDEVKSQVISAKVTPTSKAGIDQFIQAYYLDSRNQGVEIIGRIIMKLPAEIIEPLIDAEFSKNADK